VTLVDIEAEHDRSSASKPTKSPALRVVVACAFLASVIAVILIRVDRRPTPIRPSRPGVVEVRAVSCTPAELVGTTRMLAFDLTVHVESQFPVGVHLHEGMHLGVAYELADGPLFIDQQRSHIGGRADRSAFANGGDRASEPLNHWMDAQKRAGHDVLFAGIEFWSQFRSTTQHVVFLASHTFAPTTFWLGLFDVDGSAFTTSVVAGCSA
jgi:hypothetical protein